MMSNKPKVNFKKVFMSPSTKKKFATSSLKNKIKEKKESVDPKPGSTEVQVQRSFAKFRNVCFTGGGFVGLYTVGVAQCIKDKAPHLFKGKVSGASSGSLVALAVLTGIDLQLVREYFLESATEAQNYMLGAFNPLYSLENSVLLSLLNRLPNNAHDLCTGRLFLSLTQGTTYKNEIVSEYNSRNELIRAVLCCCYVPYVSRFNAPTYKGKKYIDGGITNIFPLYGEETLTIGCFSGVGDICPKFSGGSISFKFMDKTIELSRGNALAFMSALFPPAAEDLDYFYHNGYEDAENYLAERGY